MGRYRGRVPPYHLERGAVRAYIGCRASVADALRTCQRLVGNPLSMLDLTHRPERQGQISFGGDADILGEANDEITIAFHIEQRERTFELDASGSKISGQPVSVAIQPVRRTGFEGGGSGCDLTQHHIGDFPRSSRLPAHETACPQSIVDREALSEIGNAGGELTCMSESDGSLRRAVAARMDHGLAVAGL
jgi:hypothetical protein